MKAVGQALMLFWIHPAVLCCIVSIIQYRLTLYSNVNRFTQKSEPGRLGTDPPEVEGRPPKAHVKQHAATHTPSRAISTSRICMGNAGGSSKTLGVPFATWITLAGFVWDTPFVLVVWEMPGVLTVRGRRAPRGRPGHRSPVHPCEQHISIYMRQLITDMNARYE